MLERTPSRVRRIGDRCRGSTGPGIDTLKLKDPKDFPLYRQSASSIVIFTISPRGKRIRRRYSSAGMKYAVIARPPWWRKVVSFDSAEALKVSGV